MTEFKYVTIGFVTRTQKAFEDLDKFLCGPVSEELYDFCFDHDNVKYLGISDEEWLAEDPFEEAEDVGENLLEEK